MNNNIAVKIGNIHSLHSCRSTWNDIPTYKRPKRHSEIFNSSPMKERFEEKKKLQQERNIRKEVNLRKPNTLKIFYPKEKRNSKKRVYRKLF